MLPQQKQPADRIESSEKISHKIMLALHFLLMTVGEKSFEGSSHLRIAGTNSDTFTTDNRNTQQPCHGALATISNS